MVAEHAAPPEHTLDAPMPNQSSTPQHRQSLGMSSQHDSLAGLLHPQITRQGQISDWSKHQADKKLLEGYTNVKSLEVGAFSLGVFVQNLVTLLKLPDGRPEARGLLIINLFFAGLGILITALLGSFKWETLYKAGASQSERDARAVATNLKKLASSADRAAHSIQAVEEAVKWREAAKAAQDAMAALDDARQDAQDHHDIGWNAQWLRRLNFVVAVCAIVVSITGSAVGAFVLADPGVQPPSPPGG